MTEIPAKVLGIVNGVITMATNGQTSSYSASTNLDNTQTAFDYGRKATIDNFQLAHKGKELLTEYDRTFTDVIKHRLDAEMDESEVALNKCYTLLGKF